MIASPFVLGRAVSTDPDASRDGRLVATGAFLLLASFVIAIARWYVGQEETYYWWDYAVHQNLATQTALAFERSFAEGWETVGRSTHEDYNAVLAVPVVPFLLAFGQSRTIFVVGLALVYLLPFALSLGSIAAVMIRAPPAAVFWTTAVLAVLTPMTWVALLRGYPDVGAALLVTLAIRLCVSDPALSRPRSIVLVGALLATAAICRRHFLFAGPALLAACALGAVADEWSGPDRDLRVAARRVVEAVARILAAAAIGVAFAFLVARPVILRWLSQDFYSLYAGYLVEPRTLVEWYARSYGWLAWIAAVAGFVAGLRSGTLERRATVLVSGFLLVAVVQWIAIVRQVGEQYTLHVTSAIVLGLAAMGWTLWMRRGALGYVVQWAGALYVVMNFSFGLMDWHAARQPVPLRYALGGNWPPLFHDDVEGVARLVRGLRGMTTRTDPILVVASSQSLNPDLVLNAERNLYGWEGARLQIVGSPALDSRDRYPLEPLLQSRFVAIARPLQLHLPAGEQRVVQVLYDIFQERMVMAQDFVLTGEVFMLRGVASVRVYRRIRFSSLETGLATLRYFQERIPRPPGGQPDWAVVSGRFPAWSYRRADGQSTIIWHPTRTNDPAPAIALFLGRPSATVQASGSFEFLDPRCPGAAIAFGYLAPDGSLIDAGVPAVSRRPGQPGEFSVSLAARPGDRLIARLTPAEGQTSVDYCLLQLDRLAVH
jgi:hypothetical protein